MKSETELINCTLSDEISRGNSPDNDTPNSIKIDHLTPLTARFKEMPKPTILYVDDDRENLTSFKAVFRRSYQIFLASSAKEAMDILKSNEILVLITDQRMPGMSGSELLEIAAKEYPDTLRFMLTGFTDYHPLVDAINKGKVHGYFAKPFDAVNIRSRIDNNLKSHYLELENSQLLKKLRQGERFLDTIIENIPHMICVKEVENLSFVRLNLAGEELLGYPRDELVGKTAYDLFPKEDADLFTLSDRRALSCGALVDIPEERIKTRYKGVRWLHIQKMPIMDENGKARFLLSVSRDITDHKTMVEREVLLDKQLRQLKKFEALGRLASGVAHDFNNLLSPIISYTEMLYMDIPDDSPFCVYVNGIHRAALRSKDLVNQILTFSRQAESKVAPMKLDSVIKEALALIRSSFSSAIRIDEHIDPDCGFVVADATQIHQLTMNLCTNGCHAMEANGGVLTVELNQVMFNIEQHIEESSVEKSDGPESVENTTLDTIDGSGPVEDTELYFVEHISYDPVEDTSHESFHSCTVDLQNIKKQPLIACACLKVTDTGTGIDQTILDRVFDPYFTTKPIDKGTGLGFSVVQGIVKSYGGYITIKSKPGKGTEVVIHLPIHH